MSISSICNHNVVTVSPDADIGTGARLLRETHVGMLVVTETHNRLDVPMGVVTDRDLVVEVLAQGVAPESLRISDIMSRDPKTVHEDNSLELTLRLMAKHGVRRLVVIKADGSLTGVISIDDIFRRLATYFSHISEAVHFEQYEETHRRP